MNLYPYLLTISLAGCLLISGCGDSLTKEVTIEPSIPPSTTEKTTQPLPTSVTSAPASVQSPEPTATPTPAISKTPLPAVTDAPSTQNSDTPSQPPSTTKSDSTPSPAPQPQSPKEEVLPFNISRIVGMDGSSGYGIGDKKLLYTRNSGKTWGVELPDGISEQDRLIQADFYDPFSGFAYFMKETGQLLITHPIQDGGGFPTGWETALLPTSEAWEASSDITVLSNANYFDASYALLTSSPALGQMAKTLYKTTDRGKSWVRVGDITDKINGYPTGISFRAPQEGWITATYHGQESFPLFRTQDGGETWNVQQVDIPDEFKDGYANTLPPVFDMENNNHGLFIAEFVKDENKAYVLYESHDSGDSWFPIPYRLKDVQTPPVFHFNGLIEGRAISTDGKTIFTMDTYNKEDWHPIHPDIVLEEASQFSLRSSGYGWVLLNGHTMITQDGGETWSEPE